MSAQEFLHLSYNNGSLPILVSSSITLQSAPSSSPSSQSAISKTTWARNKCEMVDALIGTCPRRGVGGHWQSWNSNIDRAVPTEPWNNWMQRIIFLRDYKQLQHLYINTPYLWQFPWTFLPLGRKPHCTPLKIHWMTPSNGFWKISVKVF